MNFVVLMASYFRLKMMCNCLSTLKQARDCGEFTHLRVYDNHSDDAVVNALQYYTVIIRNMTVFFGEQNIGKAAAINQLVGRLEGEPPLNPTDIICIMDSDIVVEQDTLTHLREFVENYPDSIIVPEHVGGRAHKYKEQDVYGVVEPLGSAKKAGRVGTLCVKGGRGVAGACMTMRVQTFLDCGGFNENSIYGGNEVGLYEKYFQKYDAEGIFVLADSKVHHPIETDIGYQEYKDACQQEIRETGKSTKKGYYDVKHNPE